jgi:hypothetical protein
MPSKLRIGLDGLLAGHAADRRPRGSFDVRVSDSWDSTGVGTAQAINARYERHCDVQAAERATAAQVPHGEDRESLRYLHLLDGLQ